MKSPTSRLAPWQATPPAWRCWVCGSKPDEWWTAHGDRRPSCAEHSDQTAELLTDRHGVASSSGGLRDPWAYWAKARFYWIPRNWLFRRVTPAGRRRLVEDRRDAEIADRILGRQTCDWCRASGGE